MKTDEIKVQQLTTNVAVVNAKFFIVAAGETNLPDIKQFLAEINATIQKFKHLDIEVTND